MKPSLSNDRLLFFGGASVKSAVPPDFGASASGALLAPFWLPRTAFGGPTMEGNGTVLRLQQWSLGL